MALTKIPGFALDTTSNVTFANASVTGNLTTGNANLGNLASANFISVTSNITAGNANLGNAVTANYHIGNLYGTANLAVYATTANAVAGANVSGTVSSATTAGTVTTAAQPNITSVGTLTNTTLGSSNSLSGGNLVSATYLTGTLTTASQPNITSVGTLSSLVVTANANVGNINSGGVANITGNLTSLNANLGNLAIANYITGTLTTASQPNITNLGTLSSLTVTANITTGNLLFGSGIVTGTGNIISGNANLGNLATTNNLSVTTYVTSNLIPNANVTYSLGNSTNRWKDLFISGSTITLGDSTLSAGAINFGNSNVSIPSANGNVTISAVGNANIVVVTGTGVNVAGTLNITGNANVGNLGFGSGVVTGTANITGGNIIGIIAAGSNTITTTGNITGGNLLGVHANGNSNVNIPSANGNVNISAVGVANVVVVTGTGVNVSGYVTASGALSVANIVTTGAQGNISGANYVIANYFTGTLTTASQPNITSLGTLTSLSAGDTTITGNLTVTGNFEYANVTTFRIKDPIIEQGGNTTGSALTSSDGFDRGQLLHYYSGGSAIDAFMGYKTSTNEFIFASNASVSSEVVTVNTYGNIHAGNANLGNLTTSNYFSGVLTTASQPNITSVGTLSSLAVTGNANVGNLNATTSVIASTLTSNIATGTSPLTVTSTTRVSNLNVAYANVSDYSVVTTQTTGTFYPVFVSGNTTGNYALASNATMSYNAANGALTIGNLVSGAGSGGNITGANLVSANYFTGTLTTAAQPNITRVGTLTSLTTTGNISAGSNYFLGDGFYLSGVDAAGRVVNGTSNLNIATSGGNITMGVAGNAGIITVTGTGVNIAGYANLGSGNLLTTGNISAGFFLGNGSQLTGVDAAGRVVNGTSNLNIATSGGNITMGVAGNAGIITVTGTGANISGYMAVTGNVSAGNVLTNNLLYANGVAWSFGSGTPGGSNTYVQFNDSSSFGGNAGFTFNKATTTLTANNFVATTTANLGAVGNVTITGGTSGQVLSTNGSGVLSWVAQSGGGGGTVGITVDNFTGTGSQTAFTLSTTPTSINQVSVNYNGAILLRASYSISGSTITFGSAPASGSLIEVTTTTGVSSGAGFFATRTYTGTGSQTAFTVTSGTTVSSVMVALSGVLQTPTTDYTISGTTLTFTSAPPNGVSIQIRELSVVVATSYSTRAVAMTMGIIFGG